jgi:hypothetical protein
MEYPDKTTKQCFSDSKVKHSADTRFHVFVSFLIYTRDPVIILATLHHKAFFPYIHLLVKHNTSVKFHANISA